ncbi:Tetratricopeptide repeat protein [Candidatus Koribacter versatilis Ellin345]|uniref:Tetratricopeptide repeat protein n=1 Tax=Koribacter versatilis (strain Ellin345) TaxID=204669 RepID=Q1IPH3_KORVE|nr:hypothetical protein [Candidatus Koribacter versatilis]ABF41227.1 Tetratricopeptide repeat protein [Candidatus Koribacter versatilis Ellin345]
MRWILVAWMLLWCVAFAVAGDATQSAADQAFAKSDWPQVIALYGSKAKSDPNDAQAWYRMGRGLEETKEYAQAQDAFRHAAELKYPIPTVWVHLAANAAAAGHHEDALKTLESMAGNGFAFPKLIESEERFASVKSDPRFGAALQKIDYNSSPCDDPSHPEFRQFDFWVGEWNVFDRQQGYQVGESSVQKIIHDCVIYENWTGWLGPIGKSFNKYDATSKQWEQYWVDEGPTRQFYEGHYDNKRMLYTSAFTNAQGQRVMSRLTFFDQPDGSVRQFLETSNDEGKTWQVGYDFVYRRK